MNKIKIITEHFADIDSAVNKWITSQNNIEIVNASSSSTSSSNSSKYVTTTIIYRELPLTL